MAKKMGVMMKAIKTKKEKKATVTKKPMNKSKMC